MPEYMTIAEALEELGYVVTRASLRQAIRTGQLEALRINNRYVLRTDSFRAWLDKARVVVKEPQGATADE